jgi:uncharacterized membrane protein
MSSASEIRNAEAQLLRVFRAALEPFHTDVTNLEGRAKDHDERAAEHEKADAARFLQAQTEISKIHYELEYIKNHLNLVHDQMIQGFRELKVVINKRDPDEVTPPRRGANGR